MFSRKGHHGQGFCGSDNSKLRFTIARLKAHYRPDWYYPKALNGNWVKPGNGWGLWNGLCPFHADTKPGSVSINRQSGGFKCFSCGAHASDVIDFHRQLHGFSLRETLADLEAKL